MAGLSVLLETHKDLPEYSTRIISKTSMSSRNYYSLISCSSTSSTSPSSSSLFACPFLEYCYYCRKRLQEGNDIYMYRGDRAFCSEECRCRQIFYDDESGRGDNRSLAAAAAAAATATSAAPASCGGSPESRRNQRRAGGGKRRAAAGGFASSGRS